MLTDPNGEAVTNTTTIPARDLSSLALSASPSLLILEPLDSPAFPSVDLTDLVPLPLLVTLDAFLVDYPDLALLPPCIALDVFPRALGGLLLVIWSCNEVEVMDSLGSSEIPSLPPSPVGFSPSTVIQLTRLHS